MGSGSVLESAKKGGFTYVPPARKPLERRADLPQVTEPAAGSGGAGHDFGRVQVARGDSAQPEMGQCPITSTPRTCPFGGACHTCPTRVQAKLEVGQPDDAYEREADRVADEVMRMPDPRERSVFSGQQSVTGRQRSAVSSQLPTMSRTPSGTTGIEVSPEVEAQIQGLRGGGRPLSESERAFFEPRLGRDFSRVRIHADRHAARAARAVNARAFTVGQDVVFGAGQYAGRSDRGSRLLGHELAHVVQQMRPLPGPARVQRDTPSAPGRPIGLGFEPIFALSEAYVEILVDDTISEENANLVEVAEAYKRVSAGSLVKFTGYLSQRAMTDSEQQARERGRIVERMDSARTVLVSLGVPFDNIMLSSPTGFSPTGDGRFTIDVSEGSSLAGIFTPQATGLSQSPSIPGASLPSLSDLLTFNFKAGPVEFTIDLPKSAAVRLPAALSGVTSLSFELKAETSGTFTFTVALNGMEHIRLILETQVKIEDGGDVSGSAAIIIEATRKVCHADSPELLKARIESAGEKLTKACQEYKQATTIGDDFSKLFDVVGAIGDLYDLVDKTKSPCKEVPAARLRFGVQGPLTQPEAGERGLPSFIGLSLGIPFELPFL
ncbi:MAG: DUF4157 domain-containing protein [candidate division WOR-3 bacterium]|nr:DUF4157 domain-containing protein [candidate division WOR-3 bacterium]